MENQNPVSNGSNDANNNNQEPEVRQNLFPAGSVQTPSVAATNNMPPPATGSAAIDSALHAAQFQPPPSNNSTSSTSSTSTTQNGTTQHVPTNQTIAETPASGVTFVSTPTNHSSVGPDPNIQQPNAGVNPLSNVIGDQTNTSGNSLTNANGNQQTNASGNQVPNTNPVGANDRTNIIVGIAKEQMSALLEEQGLKRGYWNCSTTDQFSCSNAD